jgi:dihydrofolate reductase
MARKIISFIHMTLNGVVTGDPDDDKEDFAGEWTREGNTLGEASEAVIRLFDRVDTVLMGHGSYDALSRRWPTMQGAPGAVDVVSRLASKMNGAHKLVVTRDSQRVDLSWGEFEPASPIAGDDVIAQIRELKTGDGGDLVIFGSPVLVRTLADARLIDEYHFVIHPVIVETGERLFDGIGSRTDLELGDATTLEDGGVLLAYTLIDS